MNKTDQAILYYWESYQKIDKKIARLTTVTGLKMPPNGIYSYWTLKVLVLPFEFVKTFFKKLCI